MSDVRNITEEAGLLGDHVDFAVRMGFRDAPAIKAEYEALLDIAELMRSDHRGHVQMGQWLKRPDVCRTCAVLASLDAIRGAR